MKRYRFDTRKKERLTGAYWRGHFDGANDNERHAGRRDRVLYFKGYRDGAAMRRAIFNRLMR